MKTTYLIFLVITVSLTRSFAGDRSRAPTDVKPSETPKDILPEKQTEGHTCGWHCLRSIYTSYHLKTEEYALRERLGVDKKAVPFFASTKGTVHPDILRVLDQDGFQFEHLDLGKQGHLNRLHDHFKTGHYALVLIRLNQSNALHWVVLSGVEEGKYHVVDSLQKDPYKEDVTFIHRQVQTTLLIKPSHSDEIGTGKAHRQGIQQGIKGLF